MIILVFKDQTFSMFNICVQIILNAFGLENSEQSKKIYLDLFKIESVLMQYQKFSIIFAVLSYLKWSVQICI